MKRREIIKSLAAGIGVMVAGPKLAQAEVADLKFELAEWKAKMEKRNFAQALGEEVLALIDEMDDPDYPFEARSARIYYTSKSQYYIEIVPSTEKRWVP